MKLLIEDVPTNAANEIGRLVDSVLASKIIIDPSLGVIASENVQKNIGLWLDNPSQFVHLRAMDEEVLAGMILVKDFWNLCALFIRQGYQRRGVGSLLLTDAMERCRRLCPKDGIYVNALQSAVPFYEKHGFEIRFELQKAATARWYLPMKRLM